MSFNARRRADRTRTRAGAPDYALLGNVLSATKIFRDKPLGINEQLEESKKYNERQLVNFQKIHQGVRERVGLMTGQQTRCEVDAASTVFVTNKDSHDDLPPHVTQSPSQQDHREIPTQSSGYGSQESPNSSPVSKGFKNFKF